MTIKGKRPGFYFYVMDWLTDTELRRASLSTRGLWIDILCLMWKTPSTDKTRGEITLHFDEIVEMVPGADVTLVTLFVTEAERYKFCDICVTDNNMVTLVNRRMKKNDKRREQGRLRQQTFRRTKKSNASITPPISFSFSLNHIKGVSDADKTLMENYRKIISPAATPQLDGLYAEIGETPETFKIRIRKLAKKLHGSYSNG